MLNRHHIGDLEIQEDFDTSPRCCSKKCLRQNLLVILIIISVFAGVGLGFGLRPYELSPRQIKYVGFLGEIFLRMLKMLILPLIVSSLVSGLASLDTAVSGKIGLRAVIYYFITTILAVILGIILVMTIKPGTSLSGLDTSGFKGTPPITTSDTFLDLIRNMFPDNLIGACFQQYRTELEEPKKKVINEFNFNSTNISSINITTINGSELIIPEQSLFNNISSPNNDSKNVSEPTKPDYSQWIIGSKMVDGVNVMGLVVFSIALGITLGRLGNAGKPLADVFNSLNEVVMFLVDVVMKFSPIGIMFLIAAKVIEMNDVGKILEGLGWYTGTVLIGLIIHGFLVLPLIYLIFTRKNPFSYISGCMKALLTAIGTSSSSATLPVTIKCLEENNGIDNRITRFVLPIGATINMDGTALYEAVAALFIAQYRGIALDFGKVIAVSVTATAASIGAAGVPQAGLITMVMVLDAVGLPSQDIAIILAIDWFLDRIRTMINVWGDCIGAGVVHHLSQSFLRESSTDNLTEIEIVPHAQNGAHYKLTPNSLLKGSINDGYCTTEKL